MSYLVKINRRMVSKTSLDTLPLFGVPYKVDKQITEESNTDNFDKMYNAKELTKE